MNGFGPALVKGEYPMEMESSLTGDVGFPALHSPMNPDPLLRQPMSNGNLAMLGSPDASHDSQQQLMFGMNSQSSMQRSPAPSIQSEAEGIASVLNSVNQVDPFLEFGVLEHFVENIPEVQPLPDNVTCDMESPYISQWYKIIELMRDGSKVVKQQIDRMWLDSRDTEFDFTIRKRMTEVLEYMRWDKVRPHEHEVSSKLITHLYGQVRCQLDILDAAQDNDYRISLLKFSDRLANPYYQSAIALHIKEVFDTEQAIIKQSEMRQNAPLVRNENVSSSLDNIKDCCYNVEKSVQQMLSEVQELQLMCQGQLHYIDMMSVENLNPNQRAILDNAIRRRNVVTDNITRILSELDNNQARITEMMKKVLDEEVKEYHRNQAFINNGKYPTHICSINQLQEWCKKLASFISSGIQTLEKMWQYVARPLGLEMAQHPNSPPSTNIQWMNQLKLRFQEMIEELVQKGLVVDKNPPQVLMKDKRFQCTLRHLVGDALDIHQMNFRVTAHLLNAEQAIHVLTGGTGTEIKESGKIVNHQASSDYLNHGGGIISINMRNMCLKMQQRGGQRSQEMVAEHKFAMLFRASIDVHHNPSQPTTIIAQTMSLPIVVISHGKQEADAQATIFWDNAFAKLNRKPFEVDTSVPWSELLDALDKRWKKACDEGQSGKVLGLTDQARSFLTVKMFNQPNVPAGTLITWQKFNHDKNLFTFWTWFFRVMELCSSPLVRKYWNKEYIHGFITKADCTNLLMRTTNTGVFLFRFSETKLGSVSISCNGIDRDSKTRVVSNFAPDTLKDFETISLPDMVKQLTSLVYLYPAIPKDDAFGQYYTPPPSAPEDGYIRKPLKVSDPKGNSTMDQQDMTYDDSSMDSDSHLNSRQMKHSLP